MKKTYKLIDLDCANCAAKMEDAIRRLPGVSNVSVNFLTQKMILEAENLPSVLPDVVKCIHRVEPDCEVVLK